MRFFLCCDRPSDMDLGENGKQGQEDDREDIEKEDRQEDTEQVLPRFHLREDGLSDGICRCRQLLLEVRVMVRAFGFLFRMPPVHEGDVAVVRVEFAHIVIPVMAFVQADPVRDHQGIPDDLFAGRADVSDQFFVADGAEIHRYTSCGSAPIINAQWQNTKSPRGNIRLPCSGFFLRCGRGPGFMLYFSQ